MAGLSPGWTVTFGDNAVDLRQGHSDAPSDANVGYAPGGDPDTRSFKGDVPTPDRGIQPVKLIEFLLAHFNYILRLGNLLPILIFIKNAETVKMTLL
jgi:hypothetical protein